MKSLLIGETADPRCRRRSAPPSRRRAAVERLIHLRTQHLGPTSSSSAPRSASVDGLWRSASWPAAVNRVEANVRGARARGPGDVHRARRGRHGLPADPLAPTWRAAAGGRDRAEPPAAARGARRADPQAAPAGGAHAARPGRADQRVQPVPQPDRAGLHEPSVRVLKAIAGALNLSAESLLVQAGVLDGPEHADPTPRHAWRTPSTADPRLSDDQRAALMSVYRSFVDDDPTADASRVADATRERRLGGRGAARSHAVPRGTGSGRARGLGLTQPWRP